ncbi:MAG: tRNA (adenosine(37)-N6)-dimethylallyltransferase MiaA [Deltaproteobacteria bacterium]|nr:tRNA (adenosine(37)-N6)-dimethylallyltransferase MiaA [Deltaproteobacteria bacterium]MCL5277870.1 tRNA (adenosine(37)-N6)-dimethylallyltransferase MiaA [Deltaproteobacteria bacterium]
MDEKPRVVIIAGPTAAGKTTCSIELALSFHGEVVNCDSRQVYEYMDIGTAKPDPLQLHTVQHHMIDIVEPSVRFNAARYVDMADKCIDAIGGAGHVPFIVGGTGLYIKALMYGLAPVPPIDGAVRNDIREQHRLYGNEALYERLKRIDPEDASRIRATDSYRIIRALEVFTATGNPLHTYVARHGFSQKRYRYVYIVLYNPDRRRYHAAIDRRTESMIEKGLIDEVKWLIDKGYGADLPAMKTVGYAETIDYLDKKTDLNTTVNLIKRHTKAYAKRQLTWFKGIKDALWIDMQDGKERLNELIKRAIYA